MKKETVKIECAKCKRIVNKKDAYAIKYKKYDFNEFGGLSLQWTTDYLCDKCNDEFKRFLSK